MAEGGEEGTGKYVLEGEPESRLFADLRSCCLEVLELVQKPKKQCPALSRLFRLLRSSSPAALECLFDYTLFPLLLLFDAAVGCRSSIKANSKEKFAVSNDPNLPYTISDSVAESVLKCLGELLKQCPLNSVDQMTVLLKKLTCGAMLPPSESAEEFREGVIRCFRMLVSNLHPCSDESCSCRQSLFCPVLSDDSDLVSSTDAHLKHQSQPNECLLAFLQSQSASAAVGHWLSLLLNAADAEVVKGHRGSASLRIEAFVTLRVLVAKVGTADALAFFLPGVVSQLGKVLHVSKSMISGAAGSSEATEHAIRGLAEYLMVVLHDDANCSDLPSSFSPIDKGSPESFLKEIHNLRYKFDIQSGTPMESSSSRAVCGVTADVMYENKTISGGKQSLHIERTKDWIERTSAHVNKLLGLIFPKLCLHPSKRVRRGLLAATYGLLQYCSYTLKDSRIMFLECLCTLVCDDSQEVLLAAQESIESLFFSSKKQIIEHDVAEILSRLVDKLPKVVLGNEKSLALAYAQQMLGIMYYSGPQLVINHLLCSPIKAAVLLDVFNVCLSQESAFAGTLGKLTHSKPSGNRYLHAIAELKFSGKNDEQSDTAPSKTYNKIAQVKDIIIKGSPCADYELPCMPPWFAYVGSPKLYLALGGILRLISLSLITSHRKEISLSSIVEIPLCHLRMLVNEIRMRQCNEETWQSWYVRTGSGKLLRQASTAVCILNEMIFGLSDKALDNFTKMFRKSRTKLEAAQDGDSLAFKTRKVEHESFVRCPWEVWSDSARNQLIDCVGLILHEYISPEIWDLPMEHKISDFEDNEAGATTEHIFRDVAMLQKVIVDGIGIFNLCLGEDFLSSGFLRSSFYLLLENIVCSDFDVRHASDAVLHIISSKSGYSTVGQLVMANSDYVIDSLCRQLRHLDVNLHIPNVLAAMLSFIGLANAILPLLEEPMRSVSLELEILSRHRHPELTISFLKAVAEIAKAANHEASLLPDQAESYGLQIAAKLSDVKKKVRRSNTTAFDEVDTSFEQSGEEIVYCSDDVSAEEWENILLNVNDKRRYRRIVASIASSCLTAVTPLLSSAKEQECLVSLDIIEHGVTTLSFVEAAYKFEKQTKEAMKEVASLCSFFHLEDTLDAADEGTDENRLLPAVNKIWPFLVACARNRNPLSVRRCASVISSVVRVCGGDFFTRRFHNDGPHFWKLLTTSPFINNRATPKQERNKLLLPYRSTSLTSETPFSESSNLKVQAAILNMIADISRDKKSASALEAVLKKISGLVVAIACSGVTGLQEASINALSGLAYIDADLIWLLLADVYYSQKKNRDVPSLPSSEFPDLSEILPPLSSSKEYLYVQYGGQTYGFDINFSSAETVFRRLNSESFTLPLQVSLPSTHHGGKFFKADNPIAVEIVSAYHRLAIPNRIRLAESTHHPFQAPRRNATRPGCLLVHCERFPELLHPLLLRHLFRGHYLLKVLQAQVAVAVGVRAPHCCFGFLVCQYFRRPPGYRLYTALQLRRRYPPVAVLVDVPEHPLHLVPADIVGSEDEDDNAMRGLEGRACDGDFRSSELSQSPSIGFCLMSNQGCRTGLQFEKKKKKNK
ncbi:hypothetical protein V2J09_002556 [Rumex salicifolius]